MKRRGMLLLLAAVVSFTAGSQSTGRTRAAVTGNMGSSATLEFHFRTPLMELNSFSVYVRDGESGKKKMADCDIKMGTCSAEDRKDFYIKKNSIYYEILVLNRHASNIYWASYESNNGTVESEEVQLTVTTGLNRTEVTGTRGSSTRLEFHFRTPLMDVRSFSIYVRDSQGDSGDKKIADCPVSKKRCSDFNDFDMRNNSILCQISNLTEHHSNIYWVSYVSQGKVRVSDEVHLTVLQESTSSTARCHTSPQSPGIKTDGQPTISSTQNNYLLIYMIIGGVCAFLLAAALVGITWCLVRRRGGSRAPDAVPEATELPPVTTVPLTYSLLDFSHRTPSTLGLDQGMMEYSTVQHHTGTLR